MSASLTKDEFLPNVPGTGKVGTAVDPWGEGHFGEVYVDGEAVSARLAIPPTAVLLAIVPRGEAISAARCVYLAEADGTIKAFLSSSSDIEKPAQGFVTTAGALDAEVEVWSIGTVPGLSSITPSAFYYLGASGQFVSAPPSGAALIQRVGTGLSSTEIAGRIDPPMIVS